MVPPKPKYRFSLIDDRSLDKTIDNNLELPDKLRKQKNLFETADLSSRKFVLGPSKQKIRSRLSTVTLFRTAVAVRTKIIFGTTALEGTLLFGTFV